MRERLLNIVKYFGIKKQLKKFSEENFELIEAVTEAENPYNIMIDIDHIAEELADNLVMLEQIRLNYDIPLEQIRRIFEYKVGRTEGKINDETRKTRKSYESLFENNDRG